MGNGQGHQGYDSVHGGPVQSGVREEEVELNRGKNVGNCCSELSVPPEQAHCERVVQQLERLEGYRGEETYRARRELLVDEDVHDSEKPGLEALEDPVEGVQEKRGVGRDRGWRVCKKRGAQIDGESVDGQRFD